MMKVTPELVCAAIAVLGGFIAWLTKLALDVGKIRGMLETKLDVHHDRLDSHDRQLGDHSRRLVTIETGRRAP